MTKVKTNAQIIAKPDHVHDNRETDKTSQ